MYYAVTIATLVTMALALIRAVLGPTVYDRVLSVNMFGTKTVLFICVGAVASGRNDFVDLALVYALMNFIGVLAVLSAVAAFFFLIAEVSKAKLFNYLPPLLFIYATPVFLNNFDIIPSSSIVYTGLSQFALWRSGLRQRL